MLDSEHPLLLGSSSPRRREILATLGIPVRVRGFAVDEDVRPGEGVDTYLSRVTDAKLRAAVEAALGLSTAGLSTAGLSTAGLSTAGLSTGADGPGAVCGVLVADTIVVLGEDILGKPRSDADARQMIASLSGRTHEVRTRFAVAAIAPSGPAPALDAVLEAAHRQTVRTEVCFRALDASEIDGYVATGEGRDKAGAYAVQGVGAFAVASIHGSYSNVVGLPACEVVCALRALGILDTFPWPDAADRGA